MPEKTLSEDAKSDNRFVLTSLKSSKTFDSDSSCAIEDFDIDVFTVPTFVRFFRADVKPSMLLTKLPSINLTEAVSLSNETIVLLKSIFLQALFNDLRDEARALRAFEASSELFSTAIDNSSICTSSAIVFTSSRGFKALSALVLIHLDLEYKFLLFLILR